MAAEPVRTRSENPFFQKWDTPFGVPPFGRIRTDHFLPAFKAGRIVVIPGPLMSTVSHHRIEAYEALARALHPERFK